MSRNNRNNRNKEKFLLILKVLLVFVFFTALLLPAGCEREPAEERPYPDPEPPQTHEEMVEEDRTEVEDEIVGDETDGEAIIDKEAVIEEIVDEEIVDEEAVIEEIVDEAIIDKEAVIEEIVGEESGEIIDEEIISEEMISEYLISEDMIDEVLLNEDDPLGLEPGQVVRDARLRLFSEDSSIRWEVSSKEAVRRERAAEISFYPVLVDSFTGEKGEFNSEPAYDLAGEKGLYLEDDQILTLKGDARLESSQLLFLSADISWQLESNLIFSREKTIIKGKDFSAYGQGFEAEADLSRLNLKGSSGERARIVWEGSIHEEYSELQ